MLINVPQYIDVEDKVAGPLTAKQLGWMIVLGVSLIILWNVFPRLQFFLIGFPVTLIFVALAFYKPFGQPLPTFLFNGVLYMFKPKIYVWKRTFKPEIQISKSNKKVESVVIKDKRVSSQTLHGLAQVLDSEGGQHDRETDEWISSHSPKKEKRNFF
jgi:hypothetical protein